MTHTIKNRWPRGWATCAGFILFAGACGGNVEAPAPAPAARVRCVPTSVREWGESLQLSGTVSAQPGRDALVSAQAAGRLLRVLVREGDHVDAGAVLAEVEVGPLREALRQAGAVVSQTRAQLEAATLAAAREEHLFGRGISARQAWEAARANQAQAQGAVSLAAAQLDIARINLQRATVRAPIAGSVIRVLRREGEVVDGTSATPLLEVADTSELEMLASASASDLVRMRVGQPATVSFEALPGRTILAQVRSLSPAVDINTGIGTARFTLTNDGQPLPIGLFGSVQVQVTEPVSTVVVPAAAVRNGGGSRTEVVVCAGGVAHPREVVVGARREGFVEVVRGLETTHDPLHVATEGITSLEEGTPIEETP